MTGDRFQVLLVEDNAADVRLTREAMRSESADVDLHVVGDGVEALAFLRGAGRHSGRPNVDLVLLDLNLPRKGGREVLADMKSDPAIRHIPVAILSTSDAQADVEASYQLGANCYLVKPVDFGHFRDAMATLVDFWFRVARLPTRGL